MATTMSLIAKQTVGAGGAATVTFSNIPQTYTDLKVVFSCRTDQASVNQSLGVQLNSTTSGYSWRTVFGTGSSAASNSSGSASDMYVGETDAANATASTFTNGEFYIPNYTSSNNKSLSIDTVAENNGTTGYDFLGAALGPVTAAITSITIRGYGGSGNFTEYSTFYLYGISNSSTQNTTVPYASGGDVITTDGSYWYHAFKYSGSFTPLKNLTADVLVIAGGGSGGVNKAGGGGAGGVAYQAGRSLTSATSYTCTVGAGGAGVTKTSDGAVGLVGNNSVFDTITANGGGFGGGDSGPRNSGTGGSSGGASRDGTVGSATQGSSGGATGYGNLGGIGANDGGTGYSGGGGGGAGAAGSAGGYNGGNGGAGLNTWSSWATATSTGVSGYYAGGGGGGAWTFSGGGARATGGSGGGGNGGYNSGGGIDNGVSAVANTGSGGGGTANNGSGSTSTSGSGGSGIIIVRYAV